MIKQNKKIVMCGCHEGGLNAIEALLELGYNFETFVCLTRDQALKYRISGYYDYKPLAKKYGIEIYIPETYSLSNKKDQEFFKKKKFDLLVQGGWQRLFPEKILKSIKIGALGLHGSADFLPKGRGRSPMNWSLIEGRRRFLMHLFVIKPGCDDGDIISILEFDINEFDDIETMYFKYSLVYKNLLIETLPKVLSNNFKTIPQVGEATYFPKRSEADGIIDWEKMDVWEIYNFVRAQTKPYPGAYAYVDKKKIRIWRCRPFDTRLKFHNQKYGAVVERFKEKLLVNCRGGLLLIDEWETYS